MTTTKKLVPLSFSVSGYLSHYIPNANGLVHSFPSFSVIDKQNLSLQLIYQDLNSNNAVLKFEQSLDNINFDDIVDTSGNAIQFDLNMYHNSVTINLFNINTAYIRFTLLLHSITSGSFTYYTYLTN
ncbi:MAG: hypothetical protein ACOYOV_10455 [Bacteroidales bacterium]